MIAASDKQSVTVFDMRKIEQVAGGEVVQVKITKANEYSSAHSTELTVWITLSTGYSIKIPRELVNMINKKLLEVTG